MTGNVLIAEFMGKPKEYSDFYLPKFGRYVEKYGEIYWKDTFGNDEYEYHSNWEWLMPVVEKIESMRYAFEIVGNYVKIGATTIYCSQQTKQQAVYKAVVEFINWYNKQSNG